MKNYLKHISFNHSFVYDEDYDEKAASVVVLILGCFGVGVLPNCAPFDLALQVALLRALVIRVKAKVPQCDLSSEDSG